MTNPPIDPTAIRPCPFCGSNDIITTCADGPEWNVMCRKCCSSSHWDQTEDGAIAAWNRRAPKQAEGVVVVVHTEWVMTTEGPRAVTVVELPLSMIGKRVRVILEEQQ